MKLRALERDKNEETDEEEDREQSKSQYVINEDNVKTLPIINSIDGTLVSEWPRPNLCNNESWLSFNEPHTFLDLRPSEKLINQPSIVVSFDLAAKRLHANDKSIHPGYSESRYRNYQLVRSRWKTS